MWGANQIGCKHTSKLKSQEDILADRRTKQSSYSQSQVIGGRKNRKGGEGARFPDRQRDRCDALTSWHPYWRLPPDVCGMNCLLEPSAREKSTTTFHLDEQMHLGVVACGPRLQETLTMLKSALLFSSRALHFHIFTEDHLHASFKEALDSWPSDFQSRFTFTTYPITFPGDDPTVWKKLFKPCASQRLFLPLILKDVDCLLYVDTDILFLQPVEDIWDLLSLFNSTQLAAMAPEHEEPRIAWYNRFARHPYYGKTGVNSGVMLMNMTRIRQKYFQNDITPVALQWEELLMPLLQKYKLNITWGDQDLLNIIFHHNPDSLYVFPCQWNYRPDHCIYGSNCLTAEQEGVFILHGNRGVYHDDKQPAFRAVYEAIQMYPFGDNLVKALLTPLEARLQETKHTYCGRASHMFTKRLKQSIIRLQQETSGGR
ncbi:hypothetical protein UPYG_G00271460 [Umbra pygmaea]|uniref:Glucoside xylosyltransferase 1 n=1 Tax=Umbra pygmaea TaxID=75934 RepID=A0ABD0WAX5_UMBPY